MFANMEGKDDNPDMVYFYSEPLVDEVKDASDRKVLRSTGF